MGVAKVKSGTRLTAFHRHASRHYGGSALPLVKLFRLHCLRLLCLRQNRTHYVAYASRDRENYEKPDHPACIADITAFDERFRHGKTTLPDRERSRLRPVHGCGLRGATPGHLCPHRPVIGQPYWRPAALDAAAFDQCAERGCDRNGRNAERRPAGPGLPGGRTGSHGRPPRCLGLLRRGCR